MTVLTVKPDHRVEMSTDIKHVNRDKVLMVMTERMIIGIYIILAISALLNNQNHKNLFKHIFSKIFHVGRAQLSIGKGISAKKQL